MTVRGAKTLGMVPVGHDVWGEHLHKGVEEDEGVAVDVRDGLELPLPASVLKTRLAEYLRPADEWLEAALCKQPEQPAEQENRPSEANVQPVLQEKKVGSLPAAATAFS